MCMCGIAGIVGCKPDMDRAEAMLKTMARRGPDGQGVYEEADCTLLHTRLAIIDLAGGSQPMTLWYGNEEYILTYNGELYNTEEIRRELLKLGHNFKGHSDTEVLLHGYCQWGERLLDKLNGIYAFAVWEARNKKLFFARDRMGVKPLFYAKEGTVLVFASEIKTVLASRIVAPVLDEDGILQLMMLGPGRKPGSGVLRGIDELEPGCCGVYQNGKLSIRRYWMLKDRPHTDSFADTVEKVRWLVKDSIRRQMVSDVPIGTFLSGGLDSSLITSVCASDMDGALDTFSVDYENNDRYFVPGKFQSSSDEEYISLMNRSLNTRPHKTVLTPEDMLSVLEDATIARDLPGMADVDFSLNVFCGEIRKHVKVALSGECADEIFGGYPWYRDPEVKYVDGFPWAQNTAYRASFLNIEAGKCEDFVRSCYKDTLKNSDILPDNEPDEIRTKQMVNLNVRWFMQTLLDRKDRMSMYHGLEVRVPFCDHRIAEYLYTVPWHMKDYQGKEKGLLRYAMADYLPSEVLWRKKSPYPKTHDPRYESLVIKMLSSVLDKGDSPLFAMVKKESVSRLFAEEQRWPWYGQLMRRPQTIAYMLQLDFWLRHYHIHIA